VETKPFQTNSCTKRHVCCTERRSVELCCAQRDRRKNTDNESTRTRCGNGNLPSPFEIPERNHASRAAKSSNRRRQRQRTPRNCEITAGMVAHWAPHGGPWPSRRWGSLAHRAPFRDRETRREVVGESCGAPPDRPPTR
jgi:hypothetical protein